MTSHKQSCTKPAIRAALYARVSTINHGQDPEVQLRELREYCERRGFAIAHEYVDKGISGSVKSDLNWTSCLPTAVNDEWMLSWSIATTDSQGACANSSMRWKSSAHWGSTSFRSMKEWIRARPMVVLSLASSAASQSLNAN